MRDSQRGTGSRRSNLTVVKIILIDGSLQARLDSSRTGEGRSRGKALGLNQANHFSKIWSYVNEVCTLNCIVHIVHL